MTIDGTYHRPRALIATAVAAALALTACASDAPGDFVAPEDAAEAPADSGSAETAPGNDTDEQSDDTDEPSDDAAEGDEDEVRGTVTLDGATTEVSATYWCEPRESRDLGGAEVTLDVYAMDAEETVWLHAYELVRDSDGMVLQRVRVNTNVDGDMGSYQSGDLDDRSDGWPALTVEGDRVTVSAVVLRGGEQVPVEADFTLPTTEGYPGMCG